MYRIMLLVIIVVSILVSGGSIFAQNETAKNSMNPGMLPDSPFYFFERMSEKIGTFFTPSKAKAERYIRLAEERMAEIEFLNKKGKNKIAEKVMIDYEKESDRALLRIKSNPVEIEKSDELLIRLAKKKLDHQKMLVELFDKDPSISKQRIKIKLANEKKKYLDLISNISDNSRESVLSKLKSNQEYIDKKIKELEIFNNLKPDKELLSQTKFPDENDKSIVKDTNLLSNNTKIDLSKTNVALLQQGSGSPQKSLAPVDQQGGKPGMNEEGSTQVVSPKDSSGNSCTKLYLCKINCGEDIIEKCNGYSADNLYQLHQCQGNCLKYNLIYGCGMEAGCDEPCWQDYNAVCSPNKYNSCIANCEEDFGDC